MTAEKARVSSPTHFMDLIAIPCRGFCTASTQLIAELRPRIPFLVLFWVGTGLPEENIGWQIKELRGFTLSRLG